MKTIIDQSLNPAKMKPAQKLWVMGQYKENGPFADWLKTVKTCKSRSICCSASDHSNIIVRDFPNRAFVSRVVNKNFQFASGEEAECEQKIIDAELQKIRDEEERLRLQAEEAERIRKENERLAEIARQEEEKRLKEEQKRIEEAKKQEEMKKEVEYIAKRGKLYYKMTYLSFK